MISFKRWIVIGLSIILVSSAFAQFKTEKVHRARIFYTDSQENQLGQLGIELDHGLLKKGVFIECDFSDTELKTVSQAGFEYEILINDVTKFYVEQNNETNKVVDANKNLTCNQGSSEYLQPSNFNLGSMGGFFTYEEIQTQLDLMATLYPNLVKAKSPISTFQTFENRSIFWLKISDNPNIDEAEPEMMYSAIHHAREPASVSSLLYYMWYLLENYATNPEVAAIVDNSELYFVPLVNPDGYRYNQVTNPSGGGFWRKNRRDHGDGNFGVDNNRNYGIEWGTTGISFNTSSDVYCGSAAFSEPENQAMKWFCENHEFTMAFNNHSYGNLLLYPYGYQVGQPTPDDGLFQSISGEMVSQNGFTNQLSAELYPASGDSDDWMYVATANKPKIFAFTPEIGATSFWPASNQIIPVCQSTMYMNLTAAHMVSRYANVSENSGPVLANLSGTIDIDVQRLGLEGGSFSVDLQPAFGETQVLTTSGAQVINLTQLQSQTVTATYDLNPSTSPGTTIEFEVLVDNGDYVQVLALSKTYGAQNVIFSDAGSNLSNWNAGSWNTTTSSFQTAPTSITDSPGGEYSSNTNSSISLLNNVDLSSALDANLSFYARWDIEDNWDYVQVEVSTDNGGNWIPQCGQFTNAGGDNQAIGEPLYDGTQNTWVQEFISLSDYVGQTIQVRFQLVTDGFVTADGFYFDDVEISTLEAPSGGLFLSAKALLQGAYDSATDLMTDNLRSNNHLPLTEPYAGFGYTHTGGGSETTTNATFAVTGNNAIVDWIIVELRDVATPSIVIVSQSALIQRDGDIVGMDGVSPLFFNDPGFNDIVVALRHRNHYGVRNLNGITSSGNQSLDFTNLALAAYGLDPMITVNGKNVLFAADANGDGQVNSVDKNGFWRVENGFPFTYSSNKADFNLDGVINSVDKNAIWRINNSTKNEQLD
ncbi:MAG: carboxypeptidase T [Patiriisocius sp.]|jgi:carboxypeptidase T